MSSYGLDGKNFGSKTTHSLGPLIWMLSDVLALVFPDFLAHLILISRGKNRFIR